MPAPLFQQTSKPRSLGILNPVRSRALDAQRFGGVINGQPQAFNPNPVRPMTPTVAAVTPRTPQNVLQPVQQPILNDVDPNSIEGQNTLANAGIYQPGTVGATNAVANGTGQVYRPPQQTERANPLTGDNNIPMESTTTRVAAPFVQRGRTTPSGQDVSPKPLMAPTNPDETISSSMQGTFDRLRGDMAVPMKANQASKTFTGGTGKFARSFGNPTSAATYHSFVQKLFGDAQNA